METLFGSVPQLWPAMPAPAFGYVQSSPARAFGGVPAGVMGSQPGPLTPVGNFGPEWPQMAQGPMANVPVFTGSEIAVGVTAPALLAAVAVRRGRPLGPANDQEIEDFISDALDLVPGANDVEVRCEGGRATLTGTVPHKRLKRDAGEIAWAIPSVNDVQNNVTIATRRRPRTPNREAAEAPTTMASRKQA